MSSLLTIVLHDLDASLKLGDVL